MNIDTIRGFTAYAVAAIVTVLGMASLIWMTATKTIDPTVGVPIIAGIIAGGTGFLFGAEVSKQASKQTAKDILQEPPDPSGTRVGTTTVGR